MYRCYSAGMPNIPPDRPNAELAAAVEAALNMIKMHGMRAAATYLAEHGAGFALICRVLAEPGQRRTSVAVAVDQLLADAQE